MLRGFQNYPHFLEIVYDGVIRMLAPFQRWLVPGGGAERVLVLAEKVTKKPMFDCQMCGQCVLHSTGMTCPMSCPKSLRNGPCGGVRANGNCEIKPEMKCIWVQAWDRTQRMPVYGDEMLLVLPPLDRQLEGSSAWVNDFVGIASSKPEGWDL